MAKGKSPHDEKLIADLYEKLGWYTYEADKEQFDPKEVEAILKLLDVLDPLEEDDYFEKDAALKRFKERYHIDEDSEPETGKSSGKGSGGKIRPFPSKPKAKAVGEGTEKKEKKVLPFPKKVVRIAVGGAACVVLVSTLQIGSYAVADKSFFEVVSDGVNSLRITTTGSIEETGLNIEQDEEGVYHSWDEVKEIKGYDFMTPQYIPEGFELVEIRDLTGEGYNYIRGIYRHNIENKNIKFEIAVYSEEYAERILDNLDGWEKIESDFSEQIYFNSKTYEAVLIRDNMLYNVMADVNLEEFEKIIKNIE